MAQNSYSTSPLRQLSGRRFRTGCLAALGSGGKVQGLKFGCRVLEKIWFKGEKSQGTLWSLAGGRPVSFEQGPFQNPELFEQFSVTEDGKRQCSNHDPAAFEGPELFQPHPYVFHVLYALVDAYLPQGRPTSLRTFSKGHV